MKFICFRDLQSMLKGQGPKFIKGNFGKEFNKYMTTFAKLLKGY